MPELQCVGTRSSAAVTLAFVLTLVFITCTASAARAQAPQAGAARAIFPLKAAWTIPLDGKPVALTCDANRAYVGVRSAEGEPSQAPRVIAFTLADGAKRWSQEVPDVQSMATGGGLVFAAAEKGLQALDAATGEKRWQRPLDAPLSAPLHYERGWLIATTQDSQAQAIRATDGEKLWQVHLASPATAEAAVAGDAIYLPLTDNRVVSLNLQNATQIWERRILSSPTDVLVAGDRVFVGTRQRWFYALETRSGRVEWRFPIGASVVGSPTADRDRVYFLALDDLVRALERSGGTLEWRRLLTRRARFGPFAAGRMLFVSGLSKSVQGFNATDGTAAGTFDAPDDLGVPVVVSPGTTDEDFLLLTATQVPNSQLLAVRSQSLDPEPFAMSPSLAFMAGFPRWKW